MLNRIVELSLRYRGVVIALACVVLVYGVHTTTRARLDVFPEFAPPQVVIQTEAPGMSPEEVETLVTRPVEACLNGTPKLTALRSQSIQGLSAITVVFQDDADIVQCRQMITERLNEIIGRLPEGVEPPRMGPLTSTTSLTLAFGLTSTNRSPMELRTFAEWTLRPRLLGVKGVAKVEMFGGERRQIQIRVHPDRLRVFSLGLADVAAAVREAANLRGGGFVETANQRILLRAAGLPVTAAELGEVMISHHGSTGIRLSEVARVMDGAEPKFGDAQIMGAPGVILLVSSQYGANTLEVTQALEQLLAEIQPLFASERVTLHTPLFRPANFILDSLHNINRSMLMGSVLVAGVLFLFLRKFRSAFISFVSIPLSLLAAVIVLDRFGVSINTITLGGFAIAIGVVVDDAIIDVENILRRIRENRGVTRPRPLFQVILDASLEVRHAVVHATFIVALVFLPVLQMSGVQGRLFAPLAVAFLLAIGASLLVALTVTPALCLVMLAQAREQVEPVYVRWLKIGHRGCLGMVNRHPWMTSGIVLLLFAGAIAVVPFLGGEFLPEFREGHFIAHLNFLPGTALAESLRVGRQMTSELLKNPRIRSVSQQAGRAENGEDTWGPHSSEMHIDLQPLSGEDLEAAETEIRNVLQKYPGLSFSMHPFLAERMEETVSGAVAEVVVQIYGDDLDALDQTAAEVRNVLSGIRGVVDLQTDAQPGLPEVVARLKPERLLRFGFRPAQVTETLKAAFQGWTVAQIAQGHQVTDVAVTLDETCPRNPETLGSLELQNAQGQRVPLRELADLETASERSLIAHEDGQRRQQVLCSVRGRDVASFAAEAKARIRERIGLPQGVYLRFRGEAEEQSRTRGELLLNSILAAAGIVLLLAVVFPKRRHLLLVLINLPFALVGGVWAAYFTGGVLSIGSLVGFVTLFGLTMRNSIMMISHFEHLVTEEKMAWGLDAALRGAAERLLPVLMTALITALGLLPLAIGAGEAGREIEGPMAIVILGGLATSTVLNLLVLPMLALRFGQFGAGTEVAPATRLAG